MMARNSMVSFTSWTCRGTPILLILWMFLAVVRCASSIHDDNDVGSVVMEAADTRKTTKGHLPGPHSSRVITGRKSWPIQGESGPYCDACVKFNLAPYASHLRISQSTLWIYLTQSFRSIPNRHGNIASVQISLLTKNNIRNSTIRKMINYNRKGWYIIKLKNFRKNRLFQRTNNNIDLLVECFDCHIDKQGMILPPIYNHESVPPKRQNPITKHQSPVKAKRCTPNSTGCCLDDLVINLKDIVGKLADQIILPKTVNIGVCRGSCNSPHEILNTHSAMLNAAAITSSNRNNRKVRKKLCCVPQNYEPLSVLMYNGKQHIVMRTIEDMVVRDCGC